MIEPITPTEVKSIIRTMPDEVIEGFNELIAKYWDGTRARFRQDKAAELICQKMGIQVEAVFDSHYMDIEHIYEQAGWKVYYDKPAYNESYPATFEFSLPDAK